MGGQSEDPVITWSLYDLLTTFKTKKKSSPIKSHFLNWSFDKRQTIRKTYYAPFWHVRAVWQIASCTFLFSILSPRCDSFCSACDYYTIILQVYLFLTDMLIWLHPLLQTPLTPETCISTPACTRYMGNVFVYCMTRIWYGRELIVHKTIAYFLATLKINKQYGYYRRERHIMLWVWTYPCICISA